MLAELILGIVVVSGCFAGATYLDFLPRPIARPSMRASNTRKITMMAMQRTFILKPKYFLWPGIK